METVAASRTLPDATLRLHEIHPAYRPTRSGEQNHRAGVEEEVVGETGAPLAPLAMRRRRGAGFHTSCTFLAALNRSH
jgi:hypothetical protein